MYIMFEDLPIKMKMIISIKNATKKQPCTWSIVQFIFSFGPLRSAEIF